MYRSGSTEDLYVEITAIKLCRLMLNTSVLIKKKLLIHSVATSTT